MLALASPLLMEAYKFKLSFIDQNWSLISFTYINAWLLVHIEASGRKISPGACVPASTPFIYLISGYTTEVTAVT